MRMMLAAATLVLLSLPAAAEEAPKLDAHLTAAMDVMTAANAENNINAMIDTITDAMLGKVKTDHPGASDKAMAEMKKAFKEEMKAQVPNILKMQAAVFAEHFTEADLKSVAAFYRSDVGQRFINEQPAILKEITPLAFKWGQEAAMRAMEKAQDRLKREGIKL